MSVKTTVSRGKRLQVYVIVHEPLTPCPAVRPLSRFACHMACFEVRRKVLDRVKELCAARLVIHLRPKQTWK